MGRMRSDMVIILSPDSQLNPSMAHTGEQGLIQTFISKSAVKAFDKSILCRLSRCDVMPVNTPILRPVQNCHTGKLCAVVADNSLGPASPGDNLIQLPGNPGTRQRGVGDASGSHATGRKSNRTGQSDPRHPGGVWHCCGPEPCQPATTAARDFGFRKI